LAVIAEPHERHAMILTQQGKVPWSWIFALAIPAGVAMFIEQCSDVALSFTLKRFSSDPALIVFIGSLNVAFNFLVAPLAALKSDSLWTRLGRRVPFLVAGWSVMALALIATPFAPSLWILALCVLIWQFGMDLGYTGPWTPLYFEVIPKPQRGRSVAIRRAFMMTSRILFNLVFLGKFDDICSMRGVMGKGQMIVRGEHLIYIVAGLLAFACVVGSVVFIRETHPEQAEKPARISPVSFFRKNLFSRDAIPIYLLAFCCVAIKANLGSLQPLLVTEQFGYSKKMLGKIEALAMIPEMCVVLPLVFLLADRVSRLLLFRMGLLIGALHPLVYWMFVKTIAPNQIPSATSIIVFTILAHMSRMAAMVTFEPLLFDFAPRDKFGAIQAQSLFAQGFFTLFIVNGVGLWVKSWSAFFCKPNHYDYMSGYLYMSLAGALACIASLFIFKSSNAAPPCPDKPETSSPTFGKISASCGNQS
jgi:Na+/melibiose symporter-like transporter